MGKESKGKMIGMTS